ncbi:MAG TPA: ABC transporter substrate-binding protein [Chthoniobacterales bacterium]|nr:ABC transporter substrate-binding protein [Chthoniobacterales bacterium]
MKIRVLHRVIVGGLVLAFIGQLRGDQSAQLHSQRVFKVGVLVSLTGTWFTLGKNTVAALQIAEEQLEADAISQHGGYRFKFFVRDTQLDPAKALTAIQDLDERGVQIIIGPQSSSEVRMIKPYADAHNILVISQGSTASSLAIAGDNIFRLCPNDRLEADAIVALMKNDGIQHIVPLWRNDAGNNGLHDSVQSKFQALGGQYTVAAGFQYEPTTTDFSAAINSIASQTQNLQDGGAQASTIAVYLAAFDEVVDVFHSAQSNATLSFPRHWYGSDGVALSAALTGDATAAAFAASVDYPNPIFGLPDSLQSEWQPIADEIEARTRIKPDAFALSTYDVLFVLQRALQDVGDLKNFAAFKAAFVSEADAYSGITGSLALDSAGDRANGDFDFWAVRNDSWVRTGTYNNGVIMIFP